MVQSIGSLVVGFNIVEVQVDPTIEDHGHYVENPRPLVKLNRMPNDRFGAQVLLHEILHAIDEAYGVRLGERGVRTMEQALACFIRDNPTTINLIVSCLTSPIGGQ